MLNCVAVGPTQGLLLALQQMCAELPDLCLLKALDQFPASHETSRVLNVLDPEALFLEIHPSERCLELAAELRADWPGVILVGYARQCDRARRSQAAEAGVAEVLVAPFSMDDLHRALVHAFQSRTPEILDNLIVFLPAKPGDGASTTALNTATALAGLGRKVLVIDADRSNGVLAVHAGVDPAHSFDEALETSHELNEGVWEYRRTRAAGYDLLPMARRPAQRVFPPWTYRRLLRFAASHYDHVLVDLGSVLADGSEAFLRQARTIQLVTGPGEDSRFLAERRREELLALRISDERIETVDGPGREEEAAEAGSGGLFSAFRRRMLAHSHRERRA